MAPTSVELPARAWFKASEVCDIAQLQPFILRSWEKEFPDLGVAKTPGAARLYRKGDVERVLQIKDLLFVEGLTLAGARRRLEEAQPGPAQEPEPEPEAELLVTAEVRARLDKVKAGLSGLLTMLGGVAPPEGQRVSQDPSEAPAVRSKTATPQDFSLTEPAAVKPPVREAPRRPAATPPAARRAPAPPSRRRRA